jgi:phage terminase large subunit
MPEATAIKHVYRPRGNCKLLLRCRDPEVLLSGPAGTGKSRACLEKVHAMCLLNPGMRALICRKAAVTLSSTALQTYQKFVAAEAIECGDVKYYGGSSQEPASYRYKNGSVIGIGGMDKASKIMSSEYDLVYVQEATELTQEDWEAITTRLRNWRVSFQQLLADCNPQAPTHWLKQRADSGRTTMLDTIHEDNPVLFDDYGQITENGAAYIAKLDALTGVRYQRLRQGKWVAAEGVIYTGYQSTRHIIDVDDLPEISPYPDTWALDSRNLHRDPTGIPMSWKRYWAVDFGYTNPFVLQCWAEDEDGRLYLYREIYFTGRTVDEHAKQILGLVTNERGSWTEPKPSAIVCDWDAEGRATLEKELGLSTEPAFKQVVEGIEACQRRFRTAGDGRPRIFFLRTALVEKDQSLEDAHKPTCTIEEVPDYVWQEPKDGKAPKEEPVKVNDHGCDAMRYLVSHRDNADRALFRSFTV